MPANLLKSLKLKLFNFILIINVLQFDSLWVYKMIEIEMGVEGEGALTDSKAKET